MKFKDVKSGTIFVADNGNYYVKTTGIQTDVQNEAVKFEYLNDLYEFEPDEDVVVFQDM